jgi:hypothetical protein
MDKSAIEAALVYARDERSLYLEGHPMHLWWWGLEQELTRLKHGDRWEEEVEVNRMEQFFAIETALRSSAAGRMRALRSALISNMRMTTPNTEEE